MISSRLFRDSGDVQAVLTLLAASRQPARLAQYPSSADLREMLGRESFQARTRLWHDGRDRLLAYAFVDDFDNLCFDIDPARLDSLGTEVVQWGEVCLRRQPQDRASVSLDACCADDDEERIRFLENHGFQRAAESTLHFIRLLEEPIAAPVLPEGFAIRPVRGVEEAEALAALHRAAFGTEYTTAEIRRAWMTGPDYDPGLDLVAVAPDGSLAAYCLCQIHPGENVARGVLEGYTDPLATHPRYQRLGLARALILEGLTLLRQRGLQAARLATAGGNSAMRATAETAGFRVDYTTLWFHKPVSASDR